MPETPKTIADRYQVKGVIGSGGMGQVLHAHDPNLAIDVAIKILHSNDTESTAARLQREAIAAGKLNHKNIARVYNFGQTADGEPYMVMEYIDGVALSDTIKKDSHLPVSQSLEIFIQICSGLMLAHQNKIIHRDLKPSNIMLVDSQETGMRETKILDFGVAKLEQAEQKLTSTNAVIGSPLYMSPEQASALEIDARSDIYSLGCLMFETLTGIVPLKGKTALETISLHRGKAPPLISDVIEHAQFPERLVDLVNKCLAKMPEQRPQSVSEVKDELSSIKEELARKVIPQEEESVLQKFVPKTTLKLLMLGLGAIVTCSLFVFLAVKWVFDVKNNERVALEKKHDTSKKENVDINHMREVNRNYSGLVESAPTKEFMLNGQRVVRFGKFTQDKELKAYIGRNDIKCMQFRGGLLFKGQGFEYINKIPLDLLDLENTKVDQKYLKLILPIKTLGYLRYSAPSLDDKGVEDIAQLKNLKVIFLGSQKLTDHTAELLSQLPLLYTVELESKNITDKSVDALSKLKLLSISLWDTSVGKDVGVKIAAMPRVKEVILSGSKEISVDSLKALSKAGIYHLGMSRVPLKKEHFQAISQNKMLSFLDLMYNTNAPVAIAELKYLKQPINLSMRRTKTVSDELIEALTKIPLSSLDLDESNITNKQLVKLAKIKTLQNVKVQNCPFISPDGASGFHDYFKMLWHHDCGLEVAEKGTVVGLSEQMMEGEKNAQERSKIDNE